MKLSRRGRGRLVLILALTLIGALVLRLLQPSPTLAAAMQAQDGTKEFDAKALFKLAMPEEIAHGLTEAKLQRVLDEIARPVLERAAVAGSTTAQTVNEGQQAFAVTPRLIDGHIAYVSKSAAYQVEAGPKVTVLKTILNDVWHIRYLPAHPTDSPPIALIRSSLAGLHADRAKLEEIGLAGVYQGPDSGYMTWDGLEARLQELQAKIPAGM